MEFIERFPDCTLPYIDHFSELKVKFIDRFCDVCRAQQMVNGFAEFNVKTVWQFADLKVQVVEYFSGIPSSTISRSLSSQAVELTPQMSNKLPFESSLI